MMSVGLWITKILEFLKAAAVADGVVGSDGDGVSQILAGQPND
jgi:hypothetical protein